MKKLIIVILLLIVLGMYFYPGVTRDLLENTGNFALETVKEGANYLKDLVN